MANGVFFLYTVYVFVRELLRERRQKARHKRETQARMRKSQILPAQLALARELSKGSGSKSESDNTGKGSRTTASFRAAMPPPPLSSSTTKSTAGRVPDDVRARVSGWKVAVDAPAQDPGE